jgi:putative transposase
MARKDFKQVFREVLAGFVMEEDPVYSMLNWMTQQMIQIEAETKVGAEKGKHSPERKTHFSGTRVRKWDTRLGTMYLMIPKLRNGGYVPFFVTEKKRSEQALMSLIHEAYINGVSTRKIEKLAQALGIERISAGQVSQITKELDSQVAEFRTRSLETEYLFVWIDAIYEKIRVDNRVINMALMIVCGINMAGKREILAIEPMFDESKDSWASVFKNLKQRGVKRIALCVADAHQGIQQALKKELPGTSWQRCKVHFMRNIMAKLPHHAKKKVMEQVKQIWLQPDKESAMELAENIVDRFEKRFPEAMKVLEDGLEDSLQFYEFPEIDRRRIASTNLLERLNREIRRRSKVVGVFPNKESYVRLMTAYLVEYSEDWMVERGYIQLEKLIQVQLSHNQLLEKAA